MCSNAAAKARIPEGPEFWVRSDENIRLSCIISSVSPSFVFWYHEGSLINYDSRRPGGVRVTSEPWNGSHISRLEMKRARSSDSGVYTCKPSYSDPANISLHVIPVNGRLPVSNDLSHFLLHFHEQKPNSQTTLPSSSPLPSRLPLHCYHVILVIFFSSWPFTPSVSDDVLYSIAVSG